MQQNQNKNDHKNLIRLASQYAKNLPWNVFKPEDLGPAIMQFHHEQDGYYRAWAQRWFENMMFLYGNQNIRWSRRHQMAVDVDTLLQRSKNISARTQTNLVRLIAEGLSSFIYGTIPSWETLETNQQSLKSQRVAKIVQSFLDAYMEKLSMDDQLQNAANIFTVYGQVGCEIDWNDMAGHMMEIPRRKKVQAPIYTNYMAPNPITGGMLEVPTAYLGSDGQPMSEERWEYVLDDWGRQVVDKVFAGDVNTEILTPFEYRRASDSTGMFDAKYTSRMRLMDYDEFMDKYRDYPGKTKEFYKIKPVAYDPSVYSYAVRHFMMLRYVTPPSVGEVIGRKSFVFRGNYFRQKVFVIEHFDKPHPDKWPNGRRVVVANGVAVIVTKPNYSTNRRDGWHPFAEAQWLAVQPSSQSMGPINDVVTKNRELNKKDSLIATSVRRNMGSVLLVNPTTGFNADEISGEPGQVMEVLDPGNSAMYLHDTMPIPPVIQNLRENDKADAYEMSGAQDALRGDRTVGASSGYHAKIIEEREQARLTKPKRAFEKFVSTIGGKMFHCFRGNVMNMNPDLIGRIQRSVAGEATEQDIVSILTQPVDLGIDIYVKKSSMAVKSEATEQATLLELANGPAANQLQDRRVLDDMLKKFNAEALRDASGTHRDRAQKENQTFIDMVRLGVDSEGIARPVVMFEDDDDIHIAEHQDEFLRNADLLRSNEHILMEFIEHMERHRIQKQEKTGTMVPGASMQVPAMMSMSRGIQPPQPQEIQVQQMQRQQMMQEGQGGGPGHAPRQQKSDPNQPAARPQDPSAPSQNTQAGQQQ